MSTRCNLKITGPKGPALYLYRHYDGYLSETGRHIATVSVEATGKHWGHRLRSTIQMAKPFLRCVDVDEHIPERTKPAYELTDAAHGDIDFFYHLDIQPGGGVLIGYSCGYCRDIVHGEKLESHAVPGPLSEFVAAVNQDIKETNQRIDDHNKTGRYPPAVKLIEALKVPA